MFGIQHLTTAAADTFISLVVLLPLSLYNPISSQHVVILFKT